jgi:L-lactate dehydrogenase complex protein LldF
VSAERLAQQAGRFRDAAKRSLADGHRQAAIDTGTERLRTGRLHAWSALDDAQALRHRARAIRTRTIDELDLHLGTFTRAVEELGGHVRVCGTAADACAYVTDVCRRADARLVAKSKSMATEEIGLNGALEAAGLRVVETDLGEYLIQLGGGHPEHIVAPAIDLTRADAAAALSAAEQRPVEPELDELMLAARRQLRDVFKTADVGVTGANFAVAETGSICLVTNEGNADLVTALPRVHVVILGLERLVPTLAELTPLLRLLARSGTGQPLTTYTTLLTGPRRAGERDGPEELHVVVLDNGRSQLRGTRYREMLNCIRCGACLNVCPVYRKTGGAAYGPVYSGPMGAVLVPLLTGLEHAPSLPHASSLCGACTEACPVGIPLHELLLDLRRDLVEQRIGSPLERLVLSLWSYAWSTPRGYRLSTRLARLGVRLATVAGPGRTWAAARTLPRFARTRFRDRR